MASSGCGALPTPTSWLCLVSNGHGPSPSDANRRASPVTRNLTLATLLIALASGTASADTLREALGSTYRANPPRAAQREGLKGTAAGVAIARSAGRPTLNGTAGVTRDISRSGRFEVGTGKGPFLTAGADLAYPLFQG